MTLRSHTLQAGSEAQTGASRSQHSRSFYIPVSVKFILATSVALGWFLFWLWWPAAVIWAVIYYGITLGSPQSATVGMRVMNIQMRTWYGAPSYFLLGVTHAILFWLTVSLLTPFILLVGFFSTRRRLLHDMLIGTVVIHRPSWDSPHTTSGPDRGSATFDGTL